MKSLLYQELRDLARRILDTPEQELSSLQGQARVLYEKLTVLRYTDGLLEELQETMEDQTPPPPVEESPAPEKPSVVSHESAPRENDAPQPVPESPQEVPVAPAEGLLAEEPVERDEETIVSAPKSPATVSTGGKSSSGKSRGKDYDEFQQSLFGEDFFTQELDFDPDEDLFEELPATAAAPSSPSFDPEGPLPEETSVAAPPSPSLDPEGPLPEETSVAASPSPSSDPEGPLPQAQETAEKPMEEPVKASFPDEEGEISASFFSFQVIREEEEEVSSDDEESLSASSVIEETEVECVPIGQDEVSSEQVGTAVQPEEAAEVQLGDDAIDMQPQEGPQSEAPVAPAEPEPSFQGEEPRPTINQIAAEKEQVRRPSLNEILARSNVRMDMNDRIAFINNLFDGDAEAFEAAVRYIFSLTDLDVANEYIIEILKPSYNNWFEKEKYERRFSEIVLHHFIEKEKRR
ncbi:MAG TPA: hypothetical protein IAC44_05100 [Candidatus Merdimorpha stercoravium]|uniref:Uncharacterized protein n=1 Tax=Candidatus Merdimorpha stercoravium TaxID=2840863 RepID=A0A9D1H9P8_9FLAO|nr:hypothetical protein [Candidatus Merdimorpha stercoravium]